MHFKKNPPDAAALMTSARMASLAAADTANARLLDTIFHEALNGTLRAEAA